MRFYLDLSTLARGDMHGIARQEQQLARHILERENGMRFAVFDRRAKCFRAVGPDLAARLARGDQRLETKPRRRGRLAQLFGAAVPEIERLEPIALDPTTVLISAGMDWETRPPGTLATLKHATGTRYCGTCYDLIGIERPHFMPPRYQPRFEAHFRELFAHCELVMVHSAHVAEQARAFVSTRAIAAPALRMAPIGADSLMALPSQTCALPAGLQAGRYILCVGGLSPRKNHRLLYLAWSHMVERAGFDPQDMKLVLVGPARWLSADLLSEIALNPATRQAFVRLDSIDDALLKQLYLSAAFCVVPSFDEGYGLQAAEALAAGQLVLASDQGAIPELFGTHCILLNPYDVVTWSDWLQRLIADPGLLSERRAALLSEHRPISSEASAAAFLEAVEDFYQSPPPRSG